MTRLSSEKTGLQIALLVILNNYNENKMNNKFNKGDFGIHVIFTQIVPNRFCMLL